MKPKVVLHFSSFYINPDPIISLIDDHGDLVGAWRVDYLRPVTEALKPLVKMGLLELVRLHSQDHPWDSLESFLESVQAKLQAVKPIPTHCCKCGRELGNHYTRISSSESECRLCTAIRCAICGKVSKGEADRFQIDSPFKPEDLCRCPEPRIIP